MLSGIISLNGSAMFEPMRQILAYRLTMLSTDLPVKLFAYCITFMFPLAQVFMTSNRRTYRTRRCKESRLSRFLMDGAVFTLEAEDDV